MGPKFAEDTPDAIQKDLFDMDSERALNVLVKILEKDEVNLKDLAAKLKGTNTGYLKKEDVVIVDSLKNSHNVFKTLLLIGKTGSGKSSLCNRLSGHEARSEIAKLSLSTAQKLSSPIFPCCSFVVVPPGNTSSYLHYMMF